MREPSFNVHQIDPLSGKYGKIVNSYQARHVSDAITFAKGLKAANSSSEYVVSNGLRTVFDTRDAGFKIIETSDNRFYWVQESGRVDLAHVYLGGEVRRNPATGGWKKKGRWGAHPVLVRKAGCRVVDANPAKPT